MCGFTILVNKNKRNISGNLKKKILIAQNHRGPDYSKIVEKENIIFFHNRLSILDLSKKANQPMICKKTGIFIDIMAYHKKLNKKSYFVNHEILLGDKNNDINLQIKPFKQVKLNDKYYNVSHDYLKDLYRYYGKNVLTNDHNGKKLDLPPVESPK